MFIHFIMLNNKLLINFFIFLFLIYGQTSVANNFININPDGFCSSNEEGTHVDHCNFCLISELDYFNNNKNYTGLLKFNGKKNCLLITFLNHNFKIYPRSNSPPQ